jgi:hypothetical protein
VLHKDSWHGCWVLEGSKVRIIVFEIWWRRPCKSVGCLGYLKAFEARHVAQARHVAHKCVSLAASTHCLK